MFPRTSLITCCSIMLTIANSELLQRPADTEAVVGQELVILHCRTSIINSADPVEWHHRRNKDAAFEIVYKRDMILNGYRGRMQVFPDATTGQYDLIITGVTLDDAGAYTCMDRDSQSKAELIVFDKYPSNDFCLTNSPVDGFLGSNDCGLESDIVRMSCDLKYRGNLVPVLEWMNGKRVITSTISSDANGTTKSSIEQKTDQLQTSSITCRIQYIHSAIITNLTWSTAVNVTSIQNTTNVSYVGCDQESVDCSVAHHQDCSYTWLSETGTEIAISSTIKFENRPDGNYICLAKCNVRQTPCSHVVNIFNYRCSQYDSHHSAENGLPTTYPLEICIPVGILLVMAAFAIILALLFRRAACTCKERRCLSASNDSEVEKGRHNCRKDVQFPDVATLQESLLSPSKDTATKQLNNFDNEAVSS